MLGNCVHCGTYATLNPYKTCADCYEIDEQYLKFIRNRLRKDRMTVLEMAERLSVSPNRIFRWIDQGRLAARLFYFPCPICGKDLFTRACSCQKPEFVQERIHDSSLSGTKRKGFHSDLRAAAKCGSYWDRKSRIRKNQKRDIWIFTR
ncbi:MAG TPA: hypothetical protein PK360_13095 [bacterium]|nr:hypothetical protein [bacterium]